MILMLKGNYTNTPEVTIIPPSAQDLFVWKAATRPFKKRDREYFSTIAAIVFLIVIILFFIKEWLLIGVIISFMFFSYVLATVPPGEMENKITTRGILIAGKYYPWQQLSRFWFSEKWKIELIHFETLLNFPRRIQLIIPKDKKEEIKKFVEKYLLLEEPKKNQLDKAAQWLTQKFPLEST